ncbi:HlyD family secretion protein [Shewanella sp. UCD-KL12]|uniref:HlyD family secretion protein n=1 Tax=Shewanella sp. UCD-KL12 TaxID=1917163 RepID=UPI0009706C45|nr:HlyD family secretion protein [Shewanella sp. UCD-KL12]
MSRDKIYQSAIYLVFGLSFLFSLFLIASDNISPFTTQASVHRNVANIAPEVTGVITGVDVENGQHVKAGERLFTIDKRRFELAVEQAKAELIQAQDANSAKWQELASLEQSFEQREVEWQNATIKLTRYRKLQGKGLVTQEELDDAVMNVNLAQSAIKAAMAEIKRIEAELARADNLYTANGNTSGITASNVLTHMQGEGGESAAIVLARSKLAQAELDLAHTEVKAKIDGTVSNLQLQKGSYLQQGNVAMFLVNEASVWLKADFNEKGMAYLHKGKPVIISFDALPGQVFEGEIISQDRAIYDASSQSNQLAEVSNDTRWIREQQKIRTQISVQRIDAGLISGSKASVMVKNGNSVIDTLATGWITLVAYFRYIY